MLEQVTSQAPAVSQDLRDQISSLRSMGAPPKSIARRLGLPPHVVAEEIRALAAATPPPRPAPAAAQCWVSAGWSGSVEAPRQPGWIDSGTEDGPAGTGLVLVAAAAPHRRPNKVSCCGYLLDVHCLGVKDALGPKTLMREELDHFLQQFFACWEAPPVPAPLDLAKELVFGAVSYAAGLGFQPHPDFRKAAPILGEPPEKLSIKFGWHGRPRYASGPFDDPQAVLRTLEEKVGPDNFDFMIGLPEG
ncbi:MAG: helix-turn-helix domain-containing protein [Candidatus Dormibacteria bacterium]